MARRPASRLDMRKQVEAAEARGGEEAPAAKKKAAAKKPAASRAKRTKEKVQARKRLVWVVLNGSMKEEGRFPYDQRAAAEEKIEQLKLKSNKKLYFIQPLKEVIGDGPAAPLMFAAADVEIEDDAPLMDSPADDEVIEEDEVEPEPEEEEEEEDDDDDDDE